MNLLMLTKFYPFGTGEAFIENEIKEFAEYFDNIYIIACEVSDDMNTVRNLPKNVHAFKNATKNRKKQAIKNFVMGLKYMILSSESIIKDEYSYSQGIAKRAFMGYFEAKSKNIYRSIVKNHYLDITGSESFVLYSYWLFVTARVGTYIMEAKQNQLIYSFSRAHRYDLYEEKNALKYLPFRKLFLSLYDRILPCSENGTNYLSSKYPDFANKIHTAFLGTLDHGVSHPSEDNIFRIVSCSRIEEVKRVDRIVETLKVLDNENLKVEWTHIGGGSSLNFIEKMSKDNISNIKVNLLGNLPNNQVLEFYRNNAVDLFINVSSSEGLPVSIMEAISFGIPVIATDVGGTSEIVHDDQTGNLIPCEFKNEELAEKIRKYISIKNTHKYTDIRERCRQFWEQHFQAKENYTNLCNEIYSHIKNK